MLRSIWRARPLLICLVRRDLIVRYQSSVLGFLWSFAKPLALVAIFGVAFNVILRIQSPDPKVSFALHLLVGILVWSFFARCVSEAHWAILSHGNLIKKIRLPVEVFPAVTVVGNLINFLLGMVIVFPIIVVWLSGAHGSSLAQIVVEIALLIPLTLLLALLAFAVALMTSALNVFFRDVESLTEVLLQAWFYATPIVYPLSLLYDNDILGGGRFPRWLEILYWANPLTPICVAFRRILLYHDVPEVPDRTLLLYLGLATGSILVLFFVAQIIFRHYATLFADEV